MALPIQLFYWKIPHALPIHLGLIEPMTIKTELSFTVGVYVMGEQEGTLKKPLGAAIHFIDKDTKAQKG